MLKYQYYLDNANYTNDLRPLVLTYMTLLSSNTGAFIWRGTIHPRGARPPEAPPWRRGSISSMSTSRSVQLLETELSLSLVLDYGTGVWNTDIVATITMMIIDFATKATYIRLLHGKIGFMAFFSALAP